MQISAIQQSISAIQQCMSYKKNTTVGCHSLLQGIFPIQGSNPGLLHCRQILYHQSHQGNPTRMQISHNYTCIPSLPSLSSLLPIPPLQGITEHQTGLPVLQGNFSPAIHLTRQCSFYRFTVLKHCILNNTFPPRFFVQLYQELWKN